MRMLWNVVSHSPYGLVFEITYRAPIALLNAPSASLVAEAEFAFAFAAGFGVAAFPAMELRLLSAIAPATMGLPLAI